LRACLKTQHGYRQSANQDCFQSYHSRSSSPFSGGA